MFYLVPRAAAVNCVCSGFCRIANFKLAESLTPKKKKIDWAVVKIQRAPARSSFAAIDLRENQNEMDSYYLSLRLILDICVTQ